jgi:hypothetical protein
VHSQEGRADDGRAWDRRATPPAAAHLTKPDASTAPLPDLVGRLFNPDDIDHTWVGDVERHGARRPGGRSKVARRGYAGLRIAEATGATALRAAP